MKTNSKIALLSQHNGYIGREYAKALIDAKIQFYYFQFGNNEESDEIEDHRCGGLWSAPRIQDLIGCRKLQFKSLQSNQFREFIVKNKIKLAIQGGVGEIIKQEVIDIFSDGILNFHPGDLPYYRGSSTPEWQIYHRKDVVCTCHFIDKGIDTGDIIEKKVLNVNKKSYEQMRASIYPLIAKFVVEIASNYIREVKLKRKSQGEGVTWPYIGSEKIKEISKRMKI